MVYKFLFALILVPLMVFYYAFVGASLWLWFVVPLGLPAISLANFYGLALYLVFAPAVFYIIGYGINTWLM